MNLGDYEVEVEVDTQQKIETPVNICNDQVVIKNPKDGQLMVVPLNEVANFYGFEEMEQSEPQQSQPDIKISEIEETQTANSIKHENGDPQAKSRYCLQTIFKWDDEKTDFMLNQYKTLSKCVGPHKMFRTKIRLWAHIANKMRSKFNVNLTELQLRTRFACVQKRKKSANYNEMSNYSSSPERRYLKKSNVTFLNQGKVDITPSEASSSPPMSLIANFVDVDVTSSAASSPSPSPTPPPASNYKKIKIFKWNDLQTEYLLHLYGQCIDNIGPMNRFRNKKSMWCYLAKKVSEKFNANVSWKQIETRVIVVAKRRKKNMLHNKSDKAEKRVQFDKILENNDPLLIDNKISPDVTCTKYDLPRSALPKTNMTTSTPSTSKKVVSFKRISRTPSTSSSPTPSTPRQEEPTTQRRSRDLSYQKLQQVLEDHNSILKEFYQRKQEYYKEKLNILKDIRDELKKKKE